MQAGYGVRPGEGSGLERGQTTVLHSGTVLMSMFCGMIIFVLGVLNFIYAKFFDSAQTRGEIFNPCTCFSAKPSFAGLFLVDRVTFFFFASGLLLGGWGVCFIHFGACEKDLGYLGLWNCSLYPHTGTQMWISGTLGLQSIAQTSTNEQEYRMIRAYKLSTVVNSSIMKGKGNGKGCCCRYPFINNSCSWGLHFFCVKQYVVTGINFSNVCK